MPMLSIRIDLLVTAAICSFFAAPAFSAIENSPRAQVTLENWDKGGALSHWVYTHVSEVFPSAVIRRGGAIVDLPMQIKPEIGGLKLKKPDGSEQTLDEFVNNGAGDGCLVVHAGKIDLEKPVENFLPELKGTDWAGTRLRDLVNMRSGMEGAETSNDAYRDPHHKQFQLEARRGRTTR